MAQRRHGRRRPRRFRRSFQQKKPRSVSFWIKLQDWILTLISKFLPKKALLRTGEIVPFYADQDSEVEFFPALFSADPSLAGRVPWVSLRGCEQPSTPKRVSRAQHYFGNNFAFIKRESRDVDLLAESQAKKLEFVLGKVLQDRPDELVYFGVIDDAWNLALAQASSILKKPLRIVLLDEDDIEAEDNDLIGIRSLGVPLKIVKSERAQQFHRNLAKWRARFKKICVLPDDFDDAVAALGYTGALHEIKAAQEAGETPIPDLVFVPVDSGAAFVGMEISRRLCGFDDLKLIGIITDESIRKSPSEFAAMAKETWQLLSPHFQTKRREDFNDKDFQVLKVGTTDADLPDLIRWTSRFMELEGVELEHELTGPAIRRTCEYLEENKVDGKTILFWNTYSGQKVFDLSGSEFAEIKDRIRRKKFVRRTG